jgi:hypothetical protein
MFTAGSGSAALVATLASSCVYGKCGANFLAFLDETEPNKSYGALPPYQACFSKQALEAVLKKMEAFL